MGYQERPQEDPIRQFGGYNLIDGEIALPGFDSPLLVNVDLHPEGSLQGRKGFSALTTPGSGTNPILSLMRLEMPEASKGYVYAIRDVSGRKLYRTLEPATWSWEEARTGGASPTTPTIPLQDIYGWEQYRYYDEAASTEYPNALYIPRSGEVPLIALGHTNRDYDIITMPAGSLGDNTTGSGTKGYPADWVGDEPTHMRVVSVGRGAKMLAWGFPSNLSKLAYSEIDVPHNFMAANVDFTAMDPAPEVDGGHIIVRPGGGGEITGVADLYSYIVVFKRKRTLIYTNDFHAENRTVVADIPIGCVNDKAWVKVGNDILFWSEDGPRSLRTVQEYGDVRDSELAWKIPSLVKNVTAAGFNRIRCYHDAENQRVLWWAPVSSQEHNDTVFVYYYRTAKWSIWSGQVGAMVDVLHITPNSEGERFIGGSFAEGVVALQSGYADLDEAAESDIESDYYTGWLQYGSVADGSRTHWLDVVFGTHGSDVEIYYQTDLNDEWTRADRIMDAKGGTGMAWGLFAWGEAAWGDTGRSLLRYEINGMFNLIRFRFTKTGAYGWEVMAYRPEIRMKGARV